MKKKEYDQKYKPIYYKNNIEKLREAARKYYWSHREECIEKHKKYALAHPEKINNISPEKRRMYTSGWRKNNLAKSREMARISAAKQRSTVKGKLEDNVCRGINTSIKIGSKNRRKWESLVGYNINQLKVHLERKFIDGMNWGNYGKYGWHIDHKIPISAFNFEKPEDIDFKKCWALRNLRPLWATDNLRKWNKLEKPFQPSLII